MAGAGSAVGLLLGGILTTYVSWRWCFFVNVPIGIVVAAAAPRVLAESPRRPGRIDVAGAVTSTGGVALLVYGLSRAATGADGISHWGDAQVLASLTASLVLLVSLVPGLDDSGPVAYRCRPGTGITGLGGIPARRASWAARPPTPPAAPLTATTSPALDGPRANGPE
jgi:MFS family permease